VAGSWGALAGASGVVVRAEDSGNEEAGVFGVDGWSEAIRGVGIGVVSSARTNAEAGYPQMTRRVLAAVLWQWLVIAGYGVPV
jgi:hypothetical protein